MWIAPSNTPAPSPAPRAPRPVYAPDPAGLWADIPGFTAFAQEVADSLDGRDLRYPKRLRLLKRAADFGIRRFDANLIIAMVQHRMGNAAQPRQQTSQSRSTLIASLAAIVVVQSAIIVAGWWILR